MNILRFAGWDLIFIQVPGVLILALGGIVLAAMIWHYFFRRAQQSASVRYSDLSLVKTGRLSFRRRFRFLVFVLRLLAVACLFVAMARPQIGNQQRDTETEGVDIMMTLDISPSMAAEDFAPHNRLYVAKEEIHKFINRRTSDRIGLVVFAKTAFTQCPLTLDYSVLKSFLDQVDFGQAGDGTAIGLALASATNRLRGSDAKSKVIILLTDGVNNVTEIDPVTAANIAKAMGVKVYTIGAGKPGNVIYPKFDPLFQSRRNYLPSEIDEEVLQQIADITGGKYFRARSEAELEQVYTEIDAMEKTEIKVHEYMQYDELFFQWLLIGFILLLAELLLSQTYFRKIP
ncbi:MAG: VWA domain-containing protein [FCB group bacterium]|nr:VWA domain-containing protein [FCB group bacterium]